MRRIFLSLVLPVFFIPSLYASQDGGWEEIHLDNQEVRDVFIEAIGRANVYLEYCLRANFQETSKIAVEIEYNLSRFAKQHWIELRRKAHSVESTGTALDYYVLRKTKKLIWNYELQILQEICGVLKRFRKDLEQLESRSMYSKWNMGMALDNEHIALLPVPLRKRIEDIQACTVCGYY